MSIYDAGLQKLPAFCSLQEDIRTGRLPAAVTGLGHIHKTLWMHALHTMLHRRTVLLVADEAEATRMQEDLTALGERVLMLPARDLSLRQVESTSREYEQLRLGTLANMAEGRYDCVIASVDAALQYTLSPDTLLQRTLDLQAGTALPVKDLAAAFTAAGYERATQIEGAGQFAIRGGIVDIYPAASTQPIRIELWGDTVDTISYFDRITQRRTDQIDSISIPPAAEIMYDDGAMLATKIAALAASLRGRDVEKQRESLLRDVERLRSGRYPASLDKYIPLIYPQPACFFDYCSDSLLFVSEIGKIRERSRTFHWQLQEDIKGLIAEGELCRGLMEFALPRDMLHRNLQDRRNTSTILRPNINHHFQGDVW